MAHLCIHESTKRKMNKPRENANQPPSFVVEVQVIYIYVTFHGIYSFPRDSFIFNISMHFWATLDMTCSGSQGDPVSPVRGARDAPPMKSVSNQSVCAVISMSSDAKA